MPILPALATQFQSLFPNSDYGQESAHWFILTLQVILLPEQSHKPRLIFGKPDGPWRF
jgi:hypothetical protein